MAFTVPVDWTSVTGRLASRGNWSSTSRPTSWASTSTSPSCSFIPGARSGEPQGPGVVVVDRAGAGGAVPAGFPGGAAGEVAQALGVGGAGVVGAPLGEEAEGAGQL